MHQHFRFTFTALLGITIGSCATPIRASFASDLSSPPPGPRVATIEVIDSVQGKPVRTSRYALSAVDGQGWSNVDARNGTEVTKVSVKAERDGHLPVVMKVEVDRFDQNGGNTLTVKDTGIFFAGRRSVFSKIDHGDGTFVEVAMTTN